MRLFKFGRDTISVIFDKMKSFGFSKEEMSHLLIAMTEAAARGAAEGFAKELKGEFKDGK
jgi:hypothetical protein